MNINHTLLEQARTAARVTYRATAAAANVSITTIERLEHDGDATHLTVGALHRLATNVGLTITDLIVPEPADPEPGTPSGLLTEVGAALYDQHQPIADTALAQAAGVTLDVLEPVLAQLDRHLQPAGLRLARHDGRTAIVAAPRHAITQTKLTDAVKTDNTRHHIDKGDARILYAVLNGTTEKKLRSTGNGHMRVGKLINAGLIISGPRQDQPMTLAPEVAYALGLEPSKQRAAAS